MKSLIICGAPRAGTTSLYNYLFDHPEISGGKEKELHFFLGGKWGTDRWTGQETRDTYFNQFAAGECSLEASPGYMWSPVSNTVARRIRTVLPNAHLAFILRDPYERLVSNYLVELERLNINVPFNDYISKYLDGLNKSHTENSVFEVNPIRLGNYAESLKAFLLHFPLEQIHLINFDDLRSNPQTIILEICGLIGIDDSFYRNYEFSIHNQTVHYRFKKVHSYIALIYKQLPYFFQRRLGGLKRLYNYILGSRGEIIDLSLKGEVSERLNAYYKESNLELVEIYKKKNQDCPQWLQSVVSG